MPSSFVMVTRTCTTFPWTLENGTLALSSDLNRDELFWRWVGVELDYLQELQLGGLPENPLVRISDRTFRQKIKIYGNYVFWLLQVLVDGFEDIKKAAALENKDFFFQNPRELLAQICKDSAKLAVANKASFSAVTDKGWGEFSIAVILSGDGAKCLNKPYTLQGRNWKQFKAAHGDLQKFSEKQRRRE